jgi:hypothetical protein
LNINTGRRGGAKLRKSEAAPTSRDLGRLEFVVVQEMVCSTPRKGERGRRCRVGVLQREDSPEPAGVDRGRRRR